MHNIEVLGVTGQSKQGCADLRGPLRLSKGGCLGRLRKSAVSGSGSWVV